MVSHASRRITFGYSRGCGFPKEPGNWGYFTFSHEAPPYPAKTKLNPTAACNTACHGPLAADDWVFTQYYPVLRAAKGK